MSHGDSVGVVQTSVYTGVYILYSCIHMYMYMGTYMYILYSCMHTHGLRHVQCTCTLFTCRCSMDVSQLVTDRIGVLQRLYTSTCIYRCVLCSCMHTHGLRHVQCTYRHIHSLRAGSGWVSHSDRHMYSWCPVGICIHVCTGVYCIVVYAHYDCVFV